MHLLKEKKLRLRIREGYLRIRQAFSLIEITVVIALIVIFVVMALPAFQRARQSVLTSKCSVNLRQIGSVIHLYAADHSGCLPPSRDKKLDASNRPTGESDWYKSFSMWLYEYTGEGTNAISKLIKCPADTNSAVPGAEWFYVSYTDSNQYLQTWNNGMPQSDPNNSGYGYVPLSKAMQKILLADGVTAPNSYGIKGSLTPSASYINANFSDRHNGFGNCLFGDGSVRLLSKANLLMNADLLSYP